MKISHLDPGHFCDLFDFWLILDSVWEILSYIQEEAVDLDS